MAFYIAVGQHGQCNFILPSHYIEKEKSFELAAELGLHVNETKTSSTEIGEFHKYRYHETKIDGYPTRVLRCILYANPWLDKFAVVNPSQISTSWWMYVSRLTYALTVH